METLIGPATEEIANLIGTQPALLEAAASSANPFNPQLQDMTDVGNAMLFVKLFGENLRWVREWKKWIKWNGIYWKPVSSEAIIAQYAQPMVRNTMIKMGRNISDPDQAKKWFSHVAQSNAAHRVKAMLSMAEPNLMVEVRELNTNPHLIALQNAIIDLQTCQKVEPNRDQLITIASLIAYDPLATCPTFSQFIADILVNDDGTPCPAMVDYMQRSLGYCLTPSTKEQVFFILHGVGKNGKSTLMESVQNVLGDYAIQGSETLYFERDRRANNEDEARLYGARLCVTAETKETAYFSAAKVKRLTGSDRITASWKYASQFEFTPTHKLFLLCNHRPKFDPSDDAMVRRIKLVPFNFVVPTDQQDKELPEKLKAEASGIFNWMMAGLSKMNAGQGLGDEHTPDIMKAVKTAYIAENDDLQDFIDSHLTHDIMTVATKAEVYQRYRVWCVECGKPGIMNIKNLTTKLKARGMQDGVSGHSNISVWKGYSLKPTQGEENLIKALSKTG